MSAPETGPSQQAQRLRDLLDELRPYTRHESRCWYLHGESDCGSYGPPYCRLFGIMADLRSVADDLDSDPAGRAGDELADVPSEHAWHLPCCGVTVDARAYALHDHCTVCHRFVSQSQDDCPYCASVGKAGDERG